MKNVLLFLLIICCTLSSSSQIDENIKSLHENITTDLCLIVDGVIKNPSKELGKERIFLSSTILLSDSINFNLIKYAINRFQEIRSDISVIDPWRLKEDNGLDYYEKQILFAVKDKFLFVSFVYFKEDNNAPELVIWNSNTYFEPFAE